MLTLTYQSTHFYLLDGRQGKLLVDAGWAGSLPVLAARLRAHRLDLTAIGFVLPTHLHPDHAGLAQEVKQAAGARLVIHTLQIPFLPDLAAFYARKGGPYLPITVDPADIVLPADNRAALRALGFDGEVLPTPGHSPDSVSLVLDSGPAFVGDLTLPGYAADENAAALIRASWQTLLDHGARTFYPSHARPFSAGELRRLREQT